MGLDRLNGQFTARLAIIMVQSRHQSQRCLEVEPPLGPAAMACKPIFIQVHSGLGSTSRPRARGVILTRQTKTVTNDAPWSTVPGAHLGDAYGTCQAPSSRRRGPPLRPPTRRCGLAKIIAPWEKLGPSAGLELATAGCMRDGGLLICISISLCFLGRDTAFGVHIANPTDLRPGLAIFF